MVLSERVIHTFLKLKFVLKMDSKENTLNIFNNFTESMLLAQVYRLLMNEMNNSVALPLT